MKRFYWNGITSKDRYSAINDISIIINKHGTLANFLRFSDISIGLSVEIEEDNVLKLYDELKEMIQISGKFEGVDLNSSQESLVMINLTFTNYTGDFEIANPGIIE